MPRREFFPDADAMINRFERNGSAAPTPHTQGLTFGPPAVDAELFRALVDWAAEDYFDDDGYCKICEKEDHYLGSTCLHVRARAWREAHPDGI